MRFTFLGTGTSSGVPVIACDCDVCTSTDPRDNRLRCGAALEFTDARGRPRTVLIDATPDLRQQALRHKLARCDAILFTHNHVDHTFGLDEVRRFNAVQHSPIDIFAEPHTLEHLRRVYGHIFDAARNVNDSFVASVIPRVLEPGVPLELYGLRITPLRFLHGKLPILGFRIDWASGRGGGDHAMIEAPAPRPAEAGHHTEASLQSQPPSTAHWWQDDAPEQPTRTTDERAASGSTPRAASVPVSEPPRQPPTASGALATAAPIDTDALTPESLKPAHADAPVLPLAYCTDVSSIPPETWQHLDGLNVLAIDALRYRRHPTHFCFNQAIEVAQRVRPRQTYFIHMTHDIAHADAEQSLPDEIRLAYDGLVLTERSDAPAAPVQSGFGERP
ncbi:MAG: MBL fold metallo-hydrolase [Phycisphaerales bacterium]|nr:MBL fold metallo-hydrolase [Phycisphaerales bacterium]